MQVYHIKIFSFSFPHFSSIGNVIGHSILYVIHLNKLNNQQFNLKANLIYIYEFDNAITFKHQSISQFWYLGNVLEKDETGLHLQINIRWSLFIVLNSWRTLHLFHIWTIQLLSLNLKPYFRFMIFIQISFCFIICWQLCWIRGLCISFTFSCFLFPVEVGSKKFEDRGLKNFRTGALPSLGALFLFGGGGGGGRGGGSLPHYMPRK